MKLIIAMEGDTISEEMMEFFNYDLSSPTPSAFIQQRSHIKHEAFYQLFSDFATAYPGTKYLDGWNVTSPSANKSFVTFQETCAALEP